MFIKHIRIGVGIFLGSFVTADVIAASFDDSARVISSSPNLIEYSEPVQRCYNETVQTQSQNRNYVGAIVGGVAGGVLGHQVGQGRGKDVATVAGAVIGGVVGDRVANNEPKFDERQVQRCQTEEVQKTKVEGYPSR
jgi:uncharacterized protein YcfJ